MTTVYCEKRFEDVKDILSRGFALLATATELETNALHSNLIPISGCNGVVFFRIEANTYFLGKFGQFLIVHVQCEMGSIGRKSSIMTISEAIRNTIPKLVIMIGIAFGVNNKKQQIGDVLISESVIPYNIKRVGEKETIQRGQSGPCGKLLLERFKSTKDWVHTPKANSRPSKAIYCPILSGEELVDNLQRRNELTKEFPTSRGGEMEGAGLFAACDGETQWLLVKGICDFGDGNKKRNKEKYQKIAITSAISLCLKVFSQKHAFEALGLLAFDSASIKSAEIPKILPRNILFEVYSKDCEKFYVERSWDRLFLEKVENFCVWLHGLSGSGKTCLIFRNLIIKQHRFFELYLGTCVNYKAEKLFEVIYHELANATGSTAIDTKDMEFRELSSLIIALLEDFSKKSNDIFVVVLEEIPLGDERDYSSFVPLLSSLLMEMQKRMGLEKVRVVLSSIHNPRNHLKEFQKKFLQAFKIIQFESWLESDIIKLIQIIKDSLVMFLSNDFEAELIKKSNNSPRFIKLFFRNVLTSGNYETCNLKKILLETHAEFGQG